MAAILEMSAARVFLLFLLCCGFVHTQFMYPGKLSLFFNFIHFQAFTVLRPIILLLQCMATPPIQPTRHMDTLATIGHTTESESVLPSCTWTALFSPIRSALRGALVGATFGLLGKKWRLPPNNLSWACALPCLCRRDFLNKMPPN